MSGIEFRPEDVGCGNCPAPQNVVDAFMEKAGRTSTANGMHGADVGALASLAHDYRSRDEDREEFYVAASFMSKHGVTIFMAVASATISALLSAGGVWLGIRDELSTQRNDIANIKLVLKDIVDDRDKYRARYVPMVENNKEANQRQDENLNTMRESINRLGNAVDALAKSVSEQHADIAVLKNIDVMQNRIPR